jgi:hypothetical protein
MKRFTIKDAKKFLKKTNISIKNERFKLQDLVKGMNVELEHGSRDRRTNVTNDDLVLTGKIALAHLYELHDYYDRLEKIEKMNGGRYKIKRKIYFLTKY